MLLFCFRLLGALCCAVGYSTGACRYRHRLSPTALRRWRCHHLGHWARRWLRMTNVRVHQHGRPIAGGSLVVSNHQGYFDVVVLAAQHPCSFVTSVEVERTPGLGDMSRWGGSLFVERRNLRRMRADLRQLQEVIATGQPVCLFPEGTSSNGRRVLPFKNALFAAAGDHPVQPLALCYRRINGRPPVPHRLDRIAYYGDMMFPSHILGLLMLRRIEVDLHWLPVLQDGDARQRAQHAAALISERYSLLRNRALTQQEA